MATFNLNDTLSTLGGAVQGAATSLTGYAAPTNDNKFNGQSFEQNGFIVPPVNNINPNGLPHSNVKDLRNSRGYKRHLFHWFIPDLGVIKMPINPNNMQIQHSKFVTEDVTKGGYVVQYWGAQLPKITLSGTTGSTGYEGINLLYEVYLAEQYAFDSVGLSIAAQNANNAASGQISSLIGDAIGSLASINNQSLTSSTVTGVLNTALGINNTSTNFFDVDTPRLADVAFGIELYYLGSVYRGFFTSFSITETTDFLIQYNLSFSVTQSRGYRVNHLPFQRGATQPTQLDHLVNRSYK